MPGTNQAVGLLRQEKEGSDVLMARLEFLSDVSGTYSYRISYQEAGFNPAG